MQRKGIMIILMLSFLALVGLTNIITVKRVPITTTKNLAFQYISDIKNTTQDLKYLNQNGIILENTSKYAKITPRQAVEIASQGPSLGYPNRAKNIVVEYYQIEDYQFRYSNNTPSINAACYIVSFRGIARYTHCAIRANTLPIGYEYNIIVDTNSGKILGEIDYR